MSSLSIVYSDIVRNTLKLAKNKAKGSNREICSLISWVNPFDFGCWMLDFGLSKVASLPFPEEEYVPPRVGDTIKESGLSPI